MVKKYFKIKILFILGSLISSLTSEAQNELLKNELKVIPIYSPQVADMIRFDNTTSELNTGRINLSIPLINFQDPDFELSMTLSYNSGGFKPSVPDNFVGMNWCLNTGGIIYREVKGIPDDVYLENETDLTTRIRGFLGAPRINNDFFLKKLTEDPRQVIRNCKLNKPFRDDSYSFPVFANSEIEASSDIYHYSFGKYSGDFLINFDGTISVAPRNGGNVKIDLSEYKFDMDDGTNNSVLKITTEDGYVYCFGGNYSAMEYTALQWQNEFGHSDMPDPGTSGYPSCLKDNTNEISTFHLSRIIAPNSRELRINYVNRIQPEYHKNPALLIISTNYNKLLKDRVNECYVLSASPHMINAGPVNRNYSLNKIALIESILTDDKRVNFYYSYPGRNSGLMIRDVYDFGQSCRTLLDSICLFSYNSANESKIESCYMKYSLRDNRIFLNSLLQSKTGKYEFSYNGGYSLLSPMTTNIDHWNYWRGSIQNSSLIPKLKPIGLTHDVLILSDDRKPTGESYDAFLLRKVLFPTGGETAFEYEPHTYCHSLGRPSAYAYCPSLLTYEQDSIAGGARVKKISHFDGINLVKETTYKYIKDILSKRSSGILMYKPEYAAIVHKKHSKRDDAYVTVELHSSTGFNLSDYASDHVRYSSVIESDIINFISKPDSILQIYVNPQDDIRQKRFTLIVGELGDIENYSTCTIKGYGISDAKAKLIIRRNNIDIIREYNFDVSTFNKEIKYNIIKELPKGTYEVELSAEKGSYVSIELYYPTGDEKMIGPCKITKFSDYFTNPDYPGHKKYDIKDLAFFIPGLMCEIDETFNRNYLADPINLSYQRGKVTNELFYDKHRNLVKEISYFYGSCNNDEAYYIKQSPGYLGTQNGYYVQDNRLILSPYLLLKKRTWRQENNGVIETNQKYHYDNLGHLKKEELLTSKGDSCFKTYTYSFERNNSEVYNVMKQKNMCNYITDESVFTTTIGGIRKDKEEISKEYTLSRNLDNIENIPTISSISSSTNNNLLEVRRECIRYDQYGNLVYKKDDKAIDYVYIWGYHGKYIIAQIENATYEEVKQALDNDTPESISIREIPDMDKINKLRTKLSDANISTYTYTPLVGMTSMTSPDGQTIYYEYDSAGRLKEEYKLESGKRIIIKHTEYHYTNN